VTLRIGGTKVRFNNRRRPNQGIHPTAAKAPVLDEIAIAPAHVQEKMLAAVSKIEIITPPEL